MSNHPTLAVARNIVLRALLSQLHDSDELEWLQPVELKVYCDRVLSAIFIKRVLDILVEDGLAARMTQDDDRDTPYYKLSDIGIETAEMDSALDLIPGSDRMVSREHNAEKIAEIETALDLLEKDVKTNNEFGLLVGDRREAILDELSALRKLIQKSVIRAAPVMAFAKQSLTWIGKKGAATIVAESAKNLFALFLGLFG